jgi:hypothetical protein
VLRAVWRRFVRSGRLLLVDVAGWTQVAVRQKLFGCGQRVNIAARACFAPSLFLSRRLGTAGTNQRSHAFTSDCTHRSHEPPLRFLLQWPPYAISSHVLASACTQNSCSIAFYCPRSDMYPHHILPNPECWRNQSDSILHHIHPAYVRDHDSTQGHL